MRTIEADILALGRETTARRIIDAVDDLLEEWGAAAKLLDVEVNVHDHEQRKTAAALEVFNYTHLDRAWNDLRTIFDDYRMTAEHRKLALVYLRRLEQAAAPFLALLEQVRRTGETGEAAPQRPYVRPAPTRLPGRGE